MPLYRLSGHDLTLPELRWHLRDVSLPVSPTAEDLAPLGVEIVPDPAADAATELPALELARSRKLASVDESFRHAAENAHLLSSLGFEIDADETANRNVSGLIVVMESEGVERTVFCDHGNRFHELTLDQVRTVRLEIIRYAQALYARKWELRGAVAAARTQEELDAVIVNFSDVTINGED